MTAPPRAPATGYVSESEAARKAVRIPNGKLKSLDNPAAKPETDVNQLTETPVRRSAFGDWADCLFAGV
ncbi:MAG: hypothetical protein R3F07_07025 [Opitutaceae bacterium]